MSTSHQLLDDDSPLPNDLQEEVVTELEQRSQQFEEAFSDPSKGDGSPDIEWAYGSLKEFTRMTIHDFGNLFMLDAAGGLGKTYQIKQVLRDELGQEGVFAGMPSDNYQGWIYKSGHTTPLALFESLWEARHGDVLFLDDMSGITSNQKAVEMLKAATDTEGELNTVRYESSRTPTLGKEDVEVDNFVFNGSIIMSFNETPDNKHFRALADRSVCGSAYSLNFDYDDRIRLIEEVAKSDDISDLPQDIRVELVDWLKHVSDPSMDISLRTFRAVCQVRAYAESAEHAVNWKKMCLSAFDLDYEKYLIHELRDRDIPVKECTAGPNEDSQIGIFKEKTGMSSGHYYDKLSELRTQLSN